MLEKAAGDSSRTLELHHSWLGFMTWVKVPVLIMLTEKTKGRGSEECPGFVWGEQCRLLQLCGHHGFGASTLLLFGDRASVGALLSGRIYCVIRLLPRHETADLWDRWCLLQFLDDDDDRGVKQIDWNCNWVKSKEALETREVSMD